MRWRRRAMIGGGVLALAVGAAVITSFLWPEVVDPYAKFFKDDAPANAEVAPGAMPFEFIDRAGNRVNLADYKGKSAVVLVVVRGVTTDTSGDFCSFCLAQTNALAKSHREFTRRGAEVVMVFPGTAADAALFAKKAGERYDREEEPPFPLVLDRDLAAVDKLGIRGTKAKPSTYILNKSGDVVYAYVGRTQTDRPSVAAVLGQLDKLGGG